ncbi:MAG: R3H domain-containing nucleic acid-binding protein [Anaerolineae bacterium]
MTKYQITDDLDAMLAVLPPYVESAVRALDGKEDLLEVVLDLGRVPEARYLGREAILSDREVTQDDIDYVVSRVGDFTDENRAGIERTLHRISAIRNRSGRIVGLTCRVGRAVFGTIDIISDIVESGKSMLLLGRPGVGKTTMLREVARVLGDKKRVIIVDTSNEIGGDGDIPHPAIGRARRMQVPTPIMQHAVMIEAVENHMPEVIVIDEIGTELEAAAARTIAERGVQLVGTAHGNTLDNLMLNPTLMDLVGGIQSVTLSDEEARRRGTQKSILERKAPPTFDVLIEIQDRDRLVVHHDVAAAVDALLRLRPLTPELRYRDEQGNVHMEEEEPSSEEAEAVAPRMTMAPPLHQAEAWPQDGLAVFLYGVSHSRFRDAAHDLGVPARIARGLEEADALMTLRSHYRRHPQAIVEAERRGVPTYVLRANTSEQIRGSLATIFNLPFDQEELLEGPLEETQAAIRRILAGTPAVELSPQDSQVRKQQHLLARKANLLSYSLGSEPYRRVRIMRPR